MKQYDIGNGKLLTLAELTAEAKRHGLTLTTVRNRLYRGISGEALFAPVPSLAERGRSGKAKRSGRF